MNIQYINYLVKLKNAKTATKNCKEDDDRVNSIQVKSSHKKTSFAETEGKSKTERNIDFKLNSNSRKDSRGVPIIKGNKNHKVSYADNLYGTNLAIIINIDSYKKYNAIKIDTGGDDYSLNKKKNGVLCKCSIL